MMSTLKAMLGRLWVSGDNAAQLRWVVRLTLYAALIFIGTVYIYVAATNTSAGFFTDSYYYLYIADYFSHIPHPSALEIESFSTSAFPPFFSMTLSVMGFGWGDFASAHLVTVTFLVFSLIGYYLWLRANGETANQALSLVLLFSLVNEVLLHSLLINSEWMYLCFSLLGILSYQQYLADGKRYFLWVAALSIGLSVITRSIGLALLIAFIVAVFYDRVNMKMKAVALSAALLPPVIWKLSERVYRDHQGYAEQLLDYFTGESFGDLIAHLGGNVVALLDAWQNLFGEELNLFSTVAAYMLLIPALAGWFMRLKSFRLDALYTIFYVGIIVVWPYPAEMARFLTVLLPFFLFYIFDFLRVFSDRSVRRYGTAALLSLSFVAVMPAAASFIDRTFMEFPQELKPYNRVSTWYNIQSDTEALAQVKYMKQIELAVASINEYVGPQECVYASYVHYPYIRQFTNTRVVWLPYEVESVPELWHNLSECDYLYASGTTTYQSNHPPFYPAMRLKDFLQPLFVSHSVTNGKVIAVLARIKRDTSLPGS